jgi:hypothetical protein
MCISPRKKYPGIFHSLAYNEHNLLASMQTSRPRLDNYILLARFNFGKSKYAHDKKYPFAEP